MRMIALALVLILGASLADQSAKASENIGIVPEVRTGRLANGLAYFIARNAKAGEKTRFKMIVRVGAVQGGSEPQAAHILEHIVIEKLQDVAGKGALWERVSRLGGITNASTGGLSTSYFVDMPAGNPEAFSAGLQILCDWASALAPSDEEIDRQRQVVIEEARRGGSGGLSPEQLQQAIWFPGHPLLDNEPRRPGVVNASAATIRRLHRDFYVPANMAIVITGDIDPDHVLREIAVRLGSRAAGSPASPVVIPVPDLKGGNYLLIPGEETVIEISYKVRPAPATSPQRVHDVAVGQFIEAIASQGFENLAERDGAAVTSGHLSVSDLYASLFATNLLMARAYARQGHVREALAETLALLAQLRNQGFPDAVIEGARAELLNRPPLVSGVREDASRWGEAFSDGSSSPSSGDVRTAIAKLTAAEVNSTLSRWLDPANRDIFVTYTEGDSKALPGARDIPALNAQTAPAVPVSFALPPDREPTLVAVSISVGAVPAPAREAGGVLRWTLPRSGATLLFRQSAAETVRVVMRRPGGDARFEGTGAARARAASDIVGMSGLGGLNKFDLERFLASRRLSVASSIGANRDQLSASGPAGSWAQILRLLRTRITAPQCRETAFHAYIENHARNLALPGALGDDEAFARLIEASTGNKWRPDADDLKSFRFGDVCRQYRDIFADIGGMTIVVEGNITPEAAYQGVASALDYPAEASRLSLRSRKLVETIAGRTVLRRGDRPLARVALVLAVSDDSPAARLTADALRLRIFHRLRNVEQGSYAPTAGVGSSSGRSGTSLDIAFDCAPDNVDRLIAAAKEEVDRFGREGLSEVELAAARTKAGDTKVDALAIAEAWIATGTLAVRAAPTDQEVQDWIREFFGSARMHEFVLLPESH